EAARMLREPRKVEETPGKGPLTPESDDYWRLVRKTAASRPPLTEEQRVELAAIIRASRVRREQNRSSAGKMRHEAFQARHEILTSWSRSGFRHPHPGGFSVIRATERTTALCSLMSMASHVARTSGEATSTAATFTCPALATCAVISSRSAPISAALTAKTASGIRSMLFCMLSFASALSRT